MKQERRIIIDQTAYDVVISDDQETLLAARAAGRVPVGLVGTSQQELSAAHYLVEGLDGADDTFLERVVRREMGLPWIIGESGRLLVREFTMEDCSAVLPEPEDGEADRVFYTPDQLEAYIRGQYGFYEYGVWAVVRKCDGRIVGKAGITAFEEQPELGYHIFLPFRRHGYAEEACRIILDYIREEYDCPVCAVTLRSNTASRRLLEKLGFTPVDQKCNEAGPIRYQSVRNC